MLLTQKALNKIILITSVIVLAVSSSIFAFQSPVFGNTEANLRSEIDEIEQKVQKNETTLERLERKSNNLQAKLESLAVEISQVNNQIELNELKIQELQLKLVKTRAELDRQKGLLAESLTELYKRGRISTLEMLASSDNFSDYLSQQEYLDNLKDGIQESIGEVKKLEDKLDEEKKNQEELLDRRQSNRLALQDRRSEQNSLLNKTQGQQAKFEELQDDLLKQRQQAEQELNAYLASLIQTRDYVSLGKVQAGDVIGYVGSTGFSTGPHLHLEVRSGASTVDPGGSGGQLGYGFAWVLPNSDASSITQYYGCVAPYDWYYTKCGNKSFHSGLDISGWFGDPVIAPAAGDIIFRGWFGGYGNMVMIEHENGLITAYGHLLE